ncbi:MAG: DNA topoisomerase VI subunit B [Sedimentisphaerales bacterium]|nr:DNA topoisomerase VI subunit B [Sedimentisphaerales bacterium]
MKKQDSTGQLGFAFESEQESVATIVKPTKKKKKTTAKKTATDKGKTDKLVLPSKTKPAKKEKEDPIIKKRKQKDIVRKKIEQISEDKIEAQAQLMASKQRDISVSEFFAKNRHLLGFDNPRKALLTAVKEAVDNSLDACEEAQILPVIEVGITQTADDRFRIWIQDNGPGIVKQQIPNIFGRLLYGSKFHTLRMARGQQGIGISAAGMYGLLTTGKSVKITSRTGPRSQAHYYELQINTQKNRPEIIEDRVTDWEASSGTRVEIEMEARYQRGRQSVDEYLAQTAIANPHAEFRYVQPDGQVLIYERSVPDVVEVPKAVKPHPYGVELGVLMKMAKDTPEKTMTSFLSEEFSRVSSKVSQEILDKAKISARKNPSTINHAEAEKLYRAINDTKIMAPSTRCVVPIGEDALLKGLQQVVEASFYTVCTRPPAVYRGNPFQIEAGLAYGGKQQNDIEEEDFELGKNGNGNGNGNGNQEQMRVLRFANRVPLLYQQSACGIFKAVTQMNWRLYGLSQSRGSLPAGPVTVMVHIASVWVPFTSESKEAVAHYQEILKEVKLALGECGRRLGTYLRGQKRRRDESLKRSYIEKYLPAIGEALRDILSLKDQQVDTMLEHLEYVLEHSRSTKI